MKTIGILGGLGPESTIAYYGHITRLYYERRSDYGYPEILIHSFTFSEFLDTGYVLPAKVKTSIENLAAAGADFVVAACNSVHVVHEQVSGDIPIPWVSIMDSTGEQANKRGIRKVGLLGTIFTMENDFFARGLAEYGVETVKPDRAAQEKISEIIYGELITAEIRESSRNFVLDVIETLRRDGVEGIVLGCTELPFLIEQKHLSMPLFDTTMIHAQKALDLAMA